jgi:cardiolipin synthase A/B
MHTASKKQKTLRPRRTRRLLNNPVIKSLIYGRVVLIFLLLIVQLFLFLAFIIWLEPYSKYLFGSGIAVSIIFLIYLFNTDGRNEYKLAWMIPVLLFPLFGISFYILMHLEEMPREIRRNIKAIKEETKHVLALPDFTETQMPYPEISDFVMYMKNEALVPPYLNNEIKYYPSGESAFQDMMESIRHAEKFIFIEYFIINPGYMWDSILNVLIRKASEGVEVRVMYDSLGSAAISPVYYERYLKSQGIKAKAFIPLVPVVAAYLNNRDHRKIWVVDGQCAFTGGINLSDEYINKARNMNYYWKDTLVCIRGRAVRSFTGMFLQLWDLMTETEDNYTGYLEQPYASYNIPGIAMPYSDNAYNKKDIAENAYCYILSRAHRYVHVTSPYMVIDSQMMNAFIFAARRGIDVSVIFPSHIDHYITYCTGLIFIKTLIDNGVHVYEYTPGFIHSKMFISDDTSAIVGSINLDYRSLFNQFEDALFMYKCPVIADIEKDFTETRNNCREITAESYKKIPAFRRAVGRVFRLCAPLL